MHRRRYGSRSSLMTVHVYVIHPNLDGAFAELSRAGECYWPTIVYEMAHETVHLLNPIHGDTNNLEEGVAVEFSLKAQQSYDIVIQKPSMESYLHVLQLVSMLPEGSLEAAKRVRDRVGALSDVTAQQLGELFPECRRSYIEQVDREIPSETQVEKG